MLHSGIPRIILIDTEHPVRFVLHCDTTHRRTISCSCVNMQHQTAPSCQTGQCSQAGMRKRPMIRPHDRPSDDARWEREYCVKCQHTAVLEKASLWHPSLGCASQHTKRGSWPDTSKHTLGFTDNNTLCSAAFHSTDSVLRAKHRKQGWLDTTPTVSSSVNHENKYVTIHHLPYPSQPTLYAPAPLSIAAYTIRPPPLSIAAYTISPLPYPSQHTP